MKLHIIVVERAPNGILFAKTHYDTIKEREGWEIITSRVFAKKGMAHKYLYKVRQEMTQHNLSIDPNWVHPKIPKVSLKKRGGGERA